MGADEVLRGLLMYFVLPLWLAAGFADYLCHRAVHIEKTSGWRESISTYFSSAKWLFRYLLRFSLKLRRA